MSNDNKMVTVIVAPEHRYAPLLEQISQRMPVTFNSVENVPALFPLLADATYTTHLILIDIERFFDYKNTSMYDLLFAMTTMLSCAKSLRDDDDSITPYQVHIAVAVDEHTDTAMIKQALDSNIKGIYPRGYYFSIEEKCTALTEMLNGNQHTPKKIAEMLKTKRTIVKPDQIVLTGRQTQILNLILTKGASNKVIGKILNISESTVKLHITQILKKYGLRNRTQLALFCKMNTEV